MSIDISSTSLTPTIPTDLLSSGMGNMKGLPQAQQIKAASKAMEGMFVGQLMSEMGKGLGGPSESKEGGPYQDFIQQALAQQVSSGGGFGLAKFLESSITPVKPHVALAPTPEPSYHVTGTH